MKDVNDETRLINILSFLKSQGADKNTLALVLQGFIQNTGPLSDKIEDAVKRILEE